MQFSATQLTGPVAEGDGEAKTEILYQAMKGCARNALRAEYRADRLQTTALVHEAYLRLSEPQPEWESMAHFLNVVSTVMRRILVDKARARNAKKRGGMQAAGFVEHPTTGSWSVERVIALHDILEYYASFQPVKAKLVEMRTFGGFSLEEAAAALDVSKATAKRYWTIAKLQLAELLCD